MAESYAIDNATTCDKSFLFYIIIFLSFCYRGRGQFNHQSSSIFYLGTDSKLSLKDRYVPSNLGITLSAINTRGNILTVSNVDLISQHKKNKFLMVFFVKTFYIWLSQEIYFIYVYIHWILVDVVHEFVRLRMHWNHLYWIEVV